MSGTAEPCVLGKLLSDGAHLLSCYNDGTVRLWSLMDSKSVQITLSAGCSALDLLEREQMQLAAIGDLSARCHIVNLISAKVLRVVDFSNEVICCAYVPLVTSVHK